MRADPDQHRRRSGDEADSRSHPRPSDGHVQPAGLDPVQDCIGAAKAAPEAPALLSLTVTRQSDQIVDGEVGRCVAFRILRKALL